MALLTILKYPDPRLRLEGEPISVFDDALQEIIDNMLETMYFYKGVGLASTQVNIQKQLFVMDDSAERNQPAVYINPEIIKKENKFKWEEGCLSFPGIWVRVERYQDVIVRAYDRNGNPFEQTLKDLKAVCIQHETDHLHGITFIDHLSPLKRFLAEKKLKKMAERDE